MASLALVEQKTQEYAASRQNLNDLVYLLNEKIVILKEEHLPGIREAVAETANKKEALSAVLEESKGLFVKPKTMIIMGIKIGFAKGKGKLSWDTPEMVLKRIKALFTEPKEQSLYIKTKETPIKKTLQDLPAGTLKKLGITVSDVGEVVVISPTDNEIDKLVDALLNNATATAEEMEDAA